MPEKHSRLTHDGRAFWWTERLWRLAGDLPVELVEIAGIADFDRDCWFGDRTATCRAVAEHARRIHSADLDYPVILAADGHLMDGGHRIAKAWLQGATHVHAVRFVETPEPDWIEAPAEHSGRLVVVCGLPARGRRPSGGDSKSNTAPSAFVRMSGWLRWMSMSSTSEPGRWSSSSNGSSLSASFSSDSSS